VIPSLHIVGIADLLAKIGITKRHERGQEPILSDVIVSLTTHGRRLRGVHRTIRSLLAQEVLPAKIWLFIGRENQGRVPSSLTTLVGERFEIKYCEDIRSYTKFVPAMEALHGSTTVRWLVLCDDDIVYPRRWLADFRLPERSLYEAVAHRCHLVSYSADGKYLRYARWRKDVNGFFADEDPFPTGSGGIAIPISQIDPYFFQTRDFLELAPTCDDVWVYHMLKCSAVKAVHSGCGFRLKEWPLDRRDRLYRINRESDGDGFTPNDHAMQRCQEALRDRRSRWKHEQRSLGSGGQP